MVPGAECLFRPFAVLAEKKSQSYIFLVSPTSSDLGAFQEMAREPEFKNTVIYIVGPPGVGKMTVGKRLAELIGARLIHNHLWLNPVFSLIEQDGIAPLHAEVWLLVAQIRRTVFETAKLLTPASWNLIFTHAAIGESPADREISGEIADVARHRGANLIVIRLTCSADALASRVASPERRLLFKERDVNAARENAARAPFDPRHRYSFTLDTTNISAEDAAREILRLARQEPQLSKS